MELDDVEKQQLAQRLVDQAKAQGVDLIGPGGLLTGLTKTVLETALEEELAEHLGYDKQARSWSSLPDWSGHRRHLPSAGAPLRPRS